MLRCIHPSIISHEATIPLRMMTTHNYNEFRSYMTQRSTHQRASKRARTPPFDSYS